MTLEVRGPVTVSSLLPGELSDERNIGLPSARCHIIRQDSDGRVLYALLIDAPLDRRRLMDVLFAVAPYKAHGPDRFSRVLDNWALFERAKTSDGSANLMLEHAKSLNFSWQEFERHRDVFAGVLQDQSGERRVLPLISWSTGADGKRRWEFDEPDPPLSATLAELRPTAGGERLDALAGLVTLPYLLPELSKGWPAWQPLKKGGKSNYIGPASVPVMALMHRRALLNSALIQAAEAYAASPRDEDAVPVSD